MKKIIKLPEVIQKTSLSKSSIYFYISNITFPRQIALGPRSVGWLESDIENWIQQRIDGEWLKETHLNNNSSGGEP